MPVTSRRRLQPVIITREHLRQRQNSFGTYGDTAAEFVVSAGLDRSNNSAVRIRGIGHGRDNASHSLESNTFQFPNANVPGRIPYTDIRLNPQYRTPSFQNADEPNTIPNTHISVNRRYHLNEGNRNLPVINRRYHLDADEPRFRSPNSGFYQNVNRDTGRPFAQYRPPILVPYYQQNRRSDINSGIGGDVNRRIPNIVLGEGQKRHIYNTNDEIYPIVNVKYSTSSVTARVSQKQPPISSSINNEHLSKNIPLDFRNNNKHDTHKETIRKINHSTQHPSRYNNSFSFKDKTSSGPNNTDRLYFPNSNPTMYAFKYSDKVDSKINVSNSSKAVKENKESAVSDEIKNVRNNENDDEDLKEKSSAENNVRNTEDKPSNSAENILVESPALQTTIDKIREVQTRLIRKPSLVLRDQITVNELPKKSNRPRYGPRSLEVPGENVSVSRRKRDADDDDDDKEFNSDSEEDETMITDDNENNVPGTSNTMDDSSANFNSSTRQGRYKFEGFDPYFPFLRTNISSASQLQNPQSEKESRISPVYEMFSDGTYDTDEQVAEGDVMSFSDFLVSPMADKIRLERRLLFKKSNVSKSNTSIENDSHDKAKVDAKSWKNNTMTHIRDLIAARILESILSISNASANTTKPSNGRSSDSLTSAEQRHIGFMVTPYDAQESEDSPSSKPVIRILKGRIISLPDLPQELIPIIMGTYKPTYTEPQEPTFNDEGKLTENILDNAIFKLLQNDELLNIQPVVRKPPRPVTYKMSGKSPSTNYVGSLKTNEPIGKPKFVYKPNEWSLDPRCDRLTEEICLDDSDYPR